VYGRPSLAAIAIVLVAGSLRWGRPDHRANLATADAGSYRSLLGFLGGKEFRVEARWPSTGGP
jgi:hypothetical protein